MIRDKGNLKLGVIAFVVLFATLALSIGCASADTIYVPDDFAKIQWAVDNTTAGATIIVRDGTYEENVDVNKLLTIRSEKGSTNCIVQAMNPNDDVFNVTADASIIGLTIQGSDRYGIYASSSDLYAEDVMIKDNGNYGIYFDKGQDFTLKNCLIENNGGGVNFNDYASGNAVAENNVIRTNAGYGLCIHLAQSKHATITNNLIDSNSARGLHCYITGLGGGATIKDNVISNSGTYGVVIYGVKDTVIANMTIDGVTNYDGLYLQSCANITIKEPFTIQNAGRYGIYTLDSDLYAEDVTIKDNGNYGVYFDKGQDFTLKNCLIENNGGGVNFNDYASGNAVAENNVIRTNAGYGLCIHLAQSKHATITNNLIDSNSARGLHCYITGLGGGATIKDNVISNSGTYGVVIYGAKDTVITNMTIDGVTNYDGLYLQSCANITIKEPFTIQNAGRYGIYTLDSDLYAEDVTIKDNGNYGIYFDKGQDFTLKNCLIENNGGGVTASCYATGNAVAENNIIRNNTGYGLVIQLAQLQHATVTNNLIDTNSREGLYCYITGVGGGATIKDNVISNSGTYGVVIYGVKDTVITNMTIDGVTNYDGLYLQSCANITIKEPFTIQNAGRYGIYTLDSDLYAEDVTIKDNGNYGIYFDKGQDFTLKNCLIENNGGGVTASCYATGNAVAENNIIRNNTGYGLVIQLAQLQHATVTNNLIDTNSGIGLQCYITGVGGGAAIKDNVITNSGSYGAYIYGVKDSVITKNTISYSYNQGIYLHSSSDNVIYLNNFNNNQNFYYPDSNNVWNSTEKISYTYRSKQYTNYMGNYWNDYTGSDTNDDGIGDTSYSIDSDRDNYPLMQQGKYYFTSASSGFDTGAGAYPSIQGTHEGTIIPSGDIVVSKMYTYSCVGTGGHTKSIMLYENGVLKASGNWSGYQEDWQNIAITPSVTLKKGREYRYVIETGSYLQIIHVHNYTDAIGGTITCDEFTDVNGKIYTDWIPAIKLWS